MKFTPWNVFYEFYYERAINVSPVAPYRVSGLFVLVLLRFINITISDRHRIHDRPWVMQISYCCSTVASQWKIRDVSAKRRGQRRNATPSQIFTIKCLFRTFSFTLTRSFWIINGLEVCPPAQFWMVGILLPLF